MKDRPTTIGALRETGYQSRTVKQELRSNLITALAEKRTLFQGIVGYDATVIPQIENAAGPRPDGGRVLDLWDRRRVVPDDARRSACTSPRVGIGFERSSCFTGFALDDRV